MDDRILSLLREQPALSQSRIAELLGEDRNNVKYHVKKLKAEHKLEREGSSQKGKWIVP